MCDALCCSVLQSVAGCCRLLQAHISTQTHEPNAFVLLISPLSTCLLRCVAVCCTVLQRVAKCCSMLRRVAVKHIKIAQSRSQCMCAHLRQHLHNLTSVNMCVAVCCSVLQCVAVTYANSKSRTTLTSASTFTISLLFLHARIFAANSTRLSASSSSIVITRGGIFRAAISLSCLSLASL